MYEVLYIMFVNKVTLSGLPQFQTAQDNSGLFKNLEKLWASSGYFELDYEIFLKDSS